MDKFTEKFFAPMLVTILAAGLLGFFGVFWKVSTDNELTRQKLAQLDMMMMNFKHDLKDISEKVNQIAVMNTKMFELERRIKALEEEDK